MDTLELVRRDIAVLNDSEYMHVYDTETPTNGLEPDPLVPLYMMLLRQAIYLRREITRRGLMPK